LANLQKLGGWAAEKWTSEPTKRSGPDYLLHIATQKLVLAKLHKNWGSWTAEKWTGEPTKQVARHKRTSGTQPVALNTRRVERLVKKTGIRKKLQISSY